MIAMAWWTRPYAGQGKAFQGVTLIPGNAGIASDVGWFTVDATQSPGITDGWLIYCGF